jgi:hypothetical protein
LALHGAAGRRKRAQWGTQAGHSGHEAGQNNETSGAEISLRLRLMLNVNQDKTLLPPHLHLHHQVGLIALAAGDVSEDLLIKKAYRVMHESSTEIRKKQLEKFHEESREQLLK